MKFALCLSWGLVSGYVVPSVDYSDLVSLRNTEFVEESLQQLGVLSVSSVPGAADLTAETLRAASSCVLSAGTVDGEFVFEDGTLRKTLAAKTENKVVRNIDHSLADLAHPNCAKFRKLQSGFRMSISEVIKHLTPNLDQEVGVYDTQLTQLVESGLHLDHFHTYQPDPSSEITQSATLDLHIDQGLFIVLTPALLMDSDLNDVHSEEGGFFIQLPSGEIVKPELSKDSVLIMMGDGMRRWLNLDYRPVPHSMRMNRHLRSWYGQMILPSLSTYIPSLDQTVRDLRSQDTEKKAVCSNEYIFNERNLQLCGEGSLLCWTQCMPVPECSEEQEPVCVLPTSLDTDNVIRCNGADHGSHTCEPACLHSNQSFTDGAELGNSFCSGFASSMFMDGFKLPGNSADECLVFLHPDFVLDSPAKFFGGCVGAFLIGLVTELLAWGKRQLGKQEGDNVGLKLGFKALIVTFGYLAMLIVMTYSAVLFAMVCLGLTVGHRLWNFKLKVKEYTEHCCASPEEDEHEVK